MSMRENHFDLRREIVIPLAIFLGAVAATIGVILAASHFMH